LLAAVCAVAVGHSPGGAGGYGELDVAALAGDGEAGGGGLGGHGGLLGNLEGCLSMFF
jgi:hypothetical protein